MPGRFDTPAQAQFINTYEPVPFNEILQAGLSKQGVYDQNASAFEQTQTNAGQLKYIPGSEDETYITGTVIPTFEALAEEFATQDFSDPNVVRDLNKKIRELDRNHISRTQDSYKNYSQFQQDLRKLGMEGKNASYLNKFNPKGFSSEFEIFNKSPRAAVDYGKEAASYFDQLRDTHLGYDPNTGQIISGVTMPILEGIAKSNLAEFSGTEAGRQAVEAMQDQGDTRNPSAIAYDVLLSRGLEYARQNLGFAPAYSVSGGDEASITQTVSPERLLEEEPFEKDFNKYSRAKKLNKKHKEQIKELDKQIEFAKKQNNKKAKAEAAKLQLQKESIEAQDYATNHWINKFEKEFEEIKEKSPQDFDQDFVQDIFENTDVSFAHVDKLQEAFNKLVENEHAGDLSLGTIYNDLYGTEDNKRPYQKDFSFNERTIITGKASKARGAQQDYIKEQSRYVKDHWEEVDKGKSVSTTLLPVHDNNKILIPGTNDWVFSPMQGMMNAWENNPESMKIRRVTGEQLSERERSKDLKEIKKTLAEVDKNTQKRGRLEYQSTGTFDPESPFVNAVLFDSKGNRVDDYNIYVGNPSQQSAIGQTYALIGDIDNAIKYENPNYSKEVATKFTKGVIPTEINFKIFGQEVDFIKSGNDYQIVDVKGNVRGTVPATARDVENALYEAYKTTVISYRRNQSQQQ